MLMIRILKGQVGVLRGVGWNIEKRDNINITFFVRRRVVRKRIPIVIIVEVKNEEEEEEKKEEEEKGKGRGKKEEKKDIVDCQPLVSSPLPGYPPPGHKDRYFSTIKNKIK